MTALRVGWRHPEWPWALLAAGAWAASAAQRPDAMAGMAMARPWAADVGWWSVMAAAMMVPATLPTLRAVGLESLWTRRVRAPALFLAAFLAVWAAFGAAALAAWAMLGGGEDGTAAAALLFAAAAWELTAYKRRRLKRCHRMLPLAPRGRAGDRSCLRFGAYHAWASIGSCGPLMLPMVALHSVALMAALAAVGTWQRLARVPRLKACAALLAVLAEVVLALSL